MQTLFDPGREGFADGSIDWDTNDVRVMLVKDTYTFDITDKFLSDLGSVDNGRSAALAGKTVTNGVIDANDTTLVATANVSCNAYIIFQHTGSDATARAILYIDGKFRFTIAVNASSGATSLTVDPLLHAVLNGAVATKISGTGPTTITLSANAAANARTLSCSALGSGANADAVYEINISGNVFPFSPGAGQTINIAFDNGANKIAKI